MSIDYYQRMVNNYDKEIADLERKKAALDKRASDNEYKASKVNIPKSASSALIQSKMNQISRYRNDSIKAINESAKIQNKIAEKRKKRNDVNLKLQKEQRKQYEEQERQIDAIQKTYEKRIKELTNQITISNPMDYSLSSNDCGDDYDVFVSHAWEDKESFVDEFVDELTKLGIKVWYDKTHIKWGDSMRNKIDEGLKKAKFGVAILSPNYIADGKYWTKAELDGLFQLESVNGKKLLPIWHNLQKKEVMDFSPIIANKLAMNTATFTPKEIAENLLSILNEQLIR